MLEIIKYTWRLEGIVQTVREENIKRRSRIKIKCIKTWIGSWGTQSKLSKSS